MTFDDQVEEVLKWYRKAPKVNQTMFKETPKDKLVQYHHSLGRNIRNNLNLWESPWEEEIVDGVDISEKHPDAISMRIIEAVWEKVNAADIC